MASIRAAAAADRSARPSVEVIAAPPIAQIAADAAFAQRREIDALRSETEALRVEAKRLADAEAAGLVIREVPLDEIDVDYLARDRLPRVVEDDAWRALRASIAAHGQRTPLELAPLDVAGVRRYGLISGYRRYGVLRRLAEETGEARWTRARAVLRTPGTLGAAFAAMVEENEIREGLSYFERGQVCVRAVEQGAFVSVDAALESLFTTASPAKKSKIRSFVLIAEEVGDVLRHPEALGERLGLRMAQAIRVGQGGALRRFLGERLAQTRDAADEQNALAHFLAALRLRPSAAPSPVEWRLPDGGVVRARRSREGAVIEIAGRTVTAEELVAMVDAAIATLNACR